MILKLCRIVCNFYAPAEYMRLCISLRTADEQEVCLIDALQLRCLSHVAGRVHDTLQHWYLCHVVVRVHYTLQLWYLYHRVGRVHDTLQLCYLSHVAEYMILCNSVTSAM